MSWILDKKTGMSAPPAGLQGSAMVAVVVFDADGDPFSLDSCTRVYDFDTTVTPNQLLTETATDPFGVVRKKTYVYDGMNLDTESFWTKVVA